MQGACCKEFAICGVARSVCKPPPDTQVRNHQRRLGGDETTAPGQHVLCVRVCVCVCVCVCVRAACVWC